MTLNVLDLWSLILYDITNISHYLNWNSCVTNLYIGDYFITAELLLQILILWTMTLLEIITIIIITAVIIIMMISISTTIFQSITEKLEEMTYFVFTVLGVLLPPKVLYVTHE